MLEKLSCTGEQLRCNYFGQEEERERQKVHRCSSQNPAVCSKHFLAASFLFLHLAPLCCFHLVGSSTLTLKKKKKSSRRRLLKSSIKISHASRTENKQERRRECCNGDEEAWKHSATSNAAHSELREHMIALLSFSIHC